jgi:hypothetical protein
MNQMDVDDSLNAASVFELMLLNFPGLIYVYVYIQLCNASVPADVQLVPGGCVHDVQLVPDISIIFLFSSAMHLSPMMFNLFPEDVWLMFNSSPIFL